MIKTDLNFDLFILGNRQYTTSIRHKEDISRALSVNDEDNFRLSHLVEKKSKIAPLLFLYPIIESKKLKNMDEKIFQL